ncbi:hypothetical protein ACQ3I4_00250 [Zafaria sp. Z1313]|uniref:hypothetical protein n=1 Tax=unclassified Zafaria TaxID=2828765 RepID=UPI002E79B47C|nr:hypothetical protein [Zafaria sp. J156]MEE1619816.1 hypothetical protein [Zafaria sp. J156]
MSPTEQPEFTGSAPRSPDSEPLDGRDGQPVEEGSSDDPRTLDAVDPLKDVDALLERPGPGLPGADPADSESAGAAIPGDDGQDPADSDSDSERRAEDVVDSRVRPDADELPDGSGGNRGRERAGSEDEDRFDAG